MGDLKLDRITPEYAPPGCDLSVVRSGLLNQGDRGEYDLGISTDTETDTVVLRRAIQSPLGYIARYALDAKGLSNFDADHGNRIYEELSEGMTINTVARIKNHIAEAIQYAPTGITVSDIKVTLPDLETLEIGLTYTTPDYSQQLTTRVAL